MCQVPTGVWQDIQYTVHHIYYIMSIYLQWNGETLQSVSNLPKVHDGLIYEVQPSPLVAGLFASCAGISVFNIQSITSITDSKVVIK